MAKILVVDDDRAVQATIRLLLERAGHSVVVAGDGRQGLAAFEAGEFDLLFLDIFMPGMDGIETMRQVHRQQPRTPIIVISGNPIASGSVPDFLMMATKLGAIRSLQKPFKPAALLAAVAGCLEAATRPFLLIRPCRRYCLRPVMPKRRPDPSGYAPARRRTGLKANMTLATRLAIAMILLVAIAVSAVGWLSYRGLEQALLPRVLDRIETHSELVAADLLSYVRGARSDVATFPSHAAAHGMVVAHFNGGIDPVDHISEKAWRERLQTQLVGDLVAKPAYSMFRYIGIEDGQREVIRVDRSGPDGAVRVVPEAELERRGERNYFKEAIKLPPGEIYVSPLNLAGDNGVVKTPHVPTLRIAAPVFAPDGKAGGIVIINIDMGQAFDRVRSSVKPGENIYLVNGRGDYLIHPDPAREFGSQLGSPRAWQGDFPYLASASGTSQTVAQIVNDQAGQPGGAALAPALLAGKQWVGIIETVPNAFFMAPATAIQNTTLQVGLIAVLCAAALAVFVARSLTRPISRLTAAVEGIGRSDQAAIPVDAGGETGVLARAFARVMGDAHAKTAALEREVQEHRRTEAARDHHAARERLFSAAVESSNDAVVTLSLDGTITGWNPAAARLFGYDAGEAVGEGIDLIFPTDRIIEMHDLLRRVSQGETIEHHQTVQLHRDGRPVEVSFSISPIKTPSGEIIGAFKTARDITESKRTEHALRLQAEAAVTAARTTMLSLTIGTALIGLFLAVGFAHSIRKPISEAMTIIERAAAGNFTDPGPARGATRLVTC